jgi:hypothetical protein
MNYRELSTATAAMSAEDLSSFLRTRKDSIVEERTTLDVELGSNVEELRSKTYRYDELGEELAALVKLDAYHNGPHWDLLSEYELSLLAEYAGDPDGLVSAIRSSHVNEDTAMKVGLLPGPRRSSELMWEQHDARVAEIEAVEKWVPLIILLVGIVALLVYALIMHFAKYILLICTYAAFGFLGLSIPALLCCFAYDFTTSTRDR